MGPGVITSRTLASMMSRLPVMPRLCLSCCLRYRFWRVLNAAAFLPVLRRVDAERHHHLVRAGETLVRAQPGNPADQEGRRVFVLQAGHDLIAAGRDQGGPGLADQAAVEALDLAEPADQVHAGAPGAGFEPGGPVTRFLARRADQDQLVAQHTTAPGALAPLRVCLPHAAAITRQ